MHGASGPDSRDARRVERHLADISVAISVTRNGITGRLSGRTVDLSDGGMGCLVAAELKVGQQVTLDFKLPLCRDPFKVRAVVRNRAASRYGLEFLSLTSVQREAIQRFCGAAPLLAS